MDNNDTEHNGYTGPEILPDGQGGWEPCPFVMTESEVIRFLRLDIEGPKKPELTLRYYRETKKLKATRIGNRLRYTRQNILEFLEKGS